MKIEITKAQLDALMNILDEFSSGLGGGDDDTPRFKWVKKIDTMLHKNGMKRKYK